MKSGNIYSAILVLASLMLFSGCESSDDSGSSDSSASQAVGVWALEEGSSYTGNIYWYITFNEDGTYAISDNSDGSAQRVSGTYTVSGSTVTGPFENPGVGSGRIDATISDSTIQLDFVEYWQTPEKHVAYAGISI